MAETTGIEWCDSTFNPWIGCQKVSPACDHCYAEHSAPARVHRAAGRETWGRGAIRQRTGESNWEDPKRWNAGAERTGVRRRVFCGSLCDWADNQVPELWRRDLWELIRVTPHLNWLLLTKRIGVALSSLPADFCARSYPHVGIGITVANQHEANRDIPKLLAINAAMRFISVEPMLGPITFEGFFASDRYNDGTNALEELDWVICGGESGSQARPMHPAWAADLRDQCKAARTAFFFKQWGEWQPASQVNVAEHPDAEACYVRLADGSTHTLRPDDHEPYQASDEMMVRTGAKHSGRVLDGRLHNAFPA